jgi:hypothetical protein
MKVALNGPASPWLSVSLFILFPSLAIPHMKVITQIQEGLSID